MEKIFRVKTEDGHKDFFDEKEANALESDLYLRNLEKKQKEAEELKAFEEIKDHVNQLNVMIHEYELATNNRILFNWSTENEKLKVKLKVNKINSDTVEFVKIMK